MQVFQVLLISSLIAVAVGVFSYFSGLLPSLANLKKAATFNPEFMGDIDALAFSSMHRAGMEIAGPLALIGVCVLCPLYVKYGTDDAHNWWFASSISNLPYNSPVEFAILVILYMQIFWTKKVMEKYTSIIFSEYHKHTHTRRKVIFYGSPSGGETLAQYLTRLFKGDTTQFEFMEDDGVIPVTIPDEENNIRYNNDNDDTDDDTSDYGSVVTEWTINDDTDIDIDGLTDNKRNTEVEPRPTLTHTRTTFAGIFFKKKDAQIVCFKQASSVINFVGYNLQTNNREFRAVLAPHDENFIQENLTKSNLVKSSWIINAIFAAVVIAWIPFVSLVNSLFDIDHLAEKHPSFQPLADNVFIVYLGDFLAPALILVVQVAIPYLMRYVNIKFGHDIDEAHVQTTVARQFTFFVFVGSLISVGLQSMFYSMDTAWSDPEQFMYTLSESIPNSSEFFASMVTYKTFITPSLELFNVYDFDVNMEKVKTKICGCCCAGNARSPLLSPINKNKNNSDSNNIRTNNSTTDKPNKEIMYGFETPFVLLIYFTLFIFVFHTPAVLVFVFLYFTVNFFTHTYRCYSHTISRLGNSGGTIWAQFYKYVLRFQRVAVILITIYMLVSFIESQDGDATHFKYMDFFHPLFFTLPACFYSIYFSVDLVKMAELKKPSSETIYLH